MCIHIYVRRSVSFLCSLFLVIVYFREARTFSFYTACTYTCPSLSLYIYIYICMYVYIYIYIHIYDHKYISTLADCIALCCTVHIVHIYIYICMYIYIYAYVHRALTMIALTMIVPSSPHIHTQRHKSDKCVRTETVHT